MAEEAAANAQDLATEAVGREEVKNDVVIVPGVERDVGFAAGFGHGADNIESLITVEGRNLDGSDVFDLNEATPKIERKDTTADRGLEVEAEDRKDFGTGGNV